MVVGERELNHMLIWHAALALFCLIAMVVYFPAKPAIPPSKSAAGRQESNGGGAGADGASKATVKQAFKDLGRAICGFGSRDVRTLWVVSIVFALPLGVYSGYVVCSSLRSVVSCLLPSRRTFLLMIQQQANPACTFEGPSLTDSALPYDSSVYAFRIKCSDVLLYL